MCIRDRVDTAGLDEYSSFSRAATIGVHGYLLVYAVNSRSSLEKLMLVHDKLLTMIGFDNVPRVLVANKTDLSSTREVTREEGESLAKKWGCPFVEASAKIGHNIEQSFHTLLRETSNGIIQEPKESRCTIL